ncbi:hypothetical protein [Leifsonia sp. ALI-44-B]|uniref:hypothetical protein n=1 Tax=Leifsonia sp. ALI-44-B TaxID=1933776 RepID=UPI0009F81D7C|nr:hypothetical protein [Leifsonia sp. ALI-44-B]
MAGRTSRPAAGGGDERKSAFQRGREAAARGDSFRSGSGSRSGSSAGSSASSGARGRGRTPEPIPTRPALAPALVAAIALFAGVALIGNTWFVVILYVVAIFAAIMAVYAVQAGKPFWLALFVPVIALWNPIFPLPYADWFAQSEGLPWIVAQPVAAVLLVVAGIFIRGERIPERD